MSTNVPRTHRYERMKLKPCQYPNCDQYFNGTGFSKYCDEHRKREYRKVIDKLNKKIIITENPNQCYRHELGKPAVIQFECILCKVIFDVRVYPNIFVYPKFCDDHRNEFKRNLWIKNNNIIAPVIEEEKIEVMECIDPRKEVIEVDPDTFIDYDDDFALIDEREQQHE